jgi:hypothetical protein
VKRRVGGSSVILVDGAFDDQTVLTSIADVSDNGQMYGAFTMQLAVATLPGGPPSTKRSYVCSYDKQTYRFHSCSDTHETQIFSAYNDPANIVTLPDALSSATDLSEK